MKKKYSLINVKHSAVSILISTLSTVILAGIFAYLISKESIDISYTSIIIPIIHIIASVCGAIYICTTGKENLLIKCALQSVINIVLILLISFTFFSGKLDIKLTNVLAVIVGYIATAVVHFQKKGRKNSVRYKYKNS